MARRNQPHRKAARQASAQAREEAARLQREASAHQADMFLEDAEDGLIWPSGVLRLLAAVLGEEVAQ